MYTQKKSSIETYPNELLGVVYGRISSLDKEDFDRYGNRREDGSKKAQIIKSGQFLEVLSNKKKITYKVIDTCFDDNYSGGNTNRPAYQKMWNLIESGQIRFIIASELSRLSRSVIDFLQLIQHCGKYDVAVIIVGLDLDTSNAMGRVILTILIALAQFEREIASERLKSNNKVRLFEDGIINGASEILGLDRNPDKPGQFLVNHDELIKVEKILKLFLQFSSKRKILEIAKELGISGKHGKELTHYTIDRVLEQSRLRYKGIWEANKDNKDKNQDLLPDSECFQIINLPHGPLIDTDLLDYYFLISHLLSLFQIGPVQLESLGLLFPWHLKYQDQGQQ